MYYDIASDSRGRKVDAIHSAALGANPGVTGFELDRSGDEITLRFVLGEGMEQTELRLLGSKRDFYSLSMGGRLEETLAKLVRADPNLEPAGAEKAGEKIILRVLYAWPEGHVPSFAVLLEPEPPPEPPPPPPEEKPQAAPREEAPSPPRALVPARQHRFIDTPVAEQQRAAPPPPAPVPARPPAAAEAAVAVEPPAQPPVGSSPRVRESTNTAAPARAEAPQRAPRTQAEMDYQAARDAGTLQALSRFLDAHPNSPFADKAEQQAGLLRERAAYARARERDDLAGYRGFLKNFPDSQRRSEIQVRVETLESSRRRQEVEQRSRAEETKRLRAAFEQTRKLDSPEAYRIFLAAYPDSAEAVTAEKRLAAIVADEEAFRGAHGSEGHLDGYLTLYPEGRHATEARKELQLLRGRRMEADYRTTAAAGTAEAYRAFLAQWPRSPRAREARETLAALDGDRAPARPRADGHPASIATSALPLTAPRVAVPPAVDGDGADPAWAAAPELVTPLHGAAGADQLTVKAVHDGSAVFFLLRWIDPTRDVVNRPWNWSPTDKTYHQGRQLDDGASVMLFGDTAPGDACMLTGQAWQGDSWTWRANWSDLSGLADDGVMRGSKDRLPQSNPYPAADGSSQMWISRQTDDGTSGWSFFIPLDFAGPVLGSYQAAKARGSRADVAARGRWSEDRGGATWTVEFSRALNTRHADDQPLQIGRPAAVAFAVYDQADKADHSASPLIRLDLQEEQP